MELPQQPKRNSDVWSIPGRKERTSRSRRPLERSHRKQLAHAAGDLHAGDRIGDRFEIKARIGEGGMSVVYRAKDHHRDGDVALKCISPALLQDPVVTKKFVQEAKIASRLAHKGIVKVFDVHKDQGIHFLEMELLEGENLRDWTKRQREAGTVPTLQKVNSILQSICQSLAYAHQTTAHRDLKPENIALLPSGETKLMDFGLAQILRAPHSSLFRESMNQISAGTPYYMAPELLTTGASTDARVDQYSLAVIAYELLTGDLPLGVSASLFEKRPDLPLLFSNAVDRALNHHPEKRFKTIEDFARALARGARREGWISIGRRRWKSASNLIKTGIVALLCMGLTIPATTLMRRHLQDRSNQIRLWHQRIAEAQTSMNLLREQSRELEMEKEILRRKMEVEGAIRSNFSEASSNWIQASNRWHAVEASSRWLHPRLNVEGDWILLHDLLQTTRDHIAEEHFNDATASLSQFETASEQARLLTGHIKEAHQLQDAIQRLTVSGLLSNTSLKDVTDTPTLEFLESPKWEIGFQNLKAKAMRLSTEARAVYDNHLHDYKEAEQDWIKLFPKELGAPDLSFLIDVPAMQAQAETLFQAERFAKSIDTLDKATQTYQRWTREVLASQKNADAVWDQLDQRIEAVGMRFVKLNGIYWSMWEMRWMDFARWLADNREIEHLILSQIDLAPEQIGPTYPVTGLTQRAITSIAVWFGYQMNHLERPASKLPSQEDWQRIWISEGIKGDYQIGIVPEDNPERILVIKDYYLDPHIAPEDYLRPVGLGPASPNGLFDLEGNAWEWSESELTLQRHESNNSTTRKRILHGGGTFGQHRLHSFEPPRNNVVFISRPEAIGFRIILQETPTLKRESQNKTLQ